MTDWYIPNNGSFKYDKELPIVAVGVGGALVGRFTNKVAAEMFLNKAYENYGRLIDTTDDAPKAKTLSDRSRAKLEKKFTAVDLKLQDRRAWLSTWSFGMSPSEIHRRKEEIERLTEERDALEEKLS